MTTYWLIEYREDGRTVGFLRDMRRGDGGFDVFMTRDSTNALRFGSKSSAEDVINDSAFQRQQPYPERFSAEEHMDCDMPIEVKNETRP